MNGSTTRQLVVVSGYYGFDNLGDEAILEELVSELKQLGDPEKVVVLSARAEATAGKLGVRSHARGDFAGLAQLLQHTRLFISGGGGLFQNTRTLGSVLFYGLQITMAKMLGAKVMIYAQGVGPLQGTLANQATRLAFSLADSITVRDQSSLALVKSWGLQAQLTADPVWCLSQSRLPEDIERQLQSIESPNLIALSLRESTSFSNSHFRCLVEAMLAGLPDNAHVLLLPLMPQQDDTLLRNFEKTWRSSGRACSFVDTRSLVFASQWISLFACCRMVIAMRLHALIMALKAGIAVVGIEYDPKVSRLLAEFEQPGLILTKEPSLQEWQNTLANALRDQDKLGAIAIKIAEGAQKSACQNFNVLARILDVQENR